MLRDLLFIIGTIIVAVLIAVALGIALWELLPNEAEKLDAYERLYANCLARETISDSECQDIARVQAFGK